MSPINHRLRQPALANLIELIADGGPEAYYSGVVADAIATAIQHGGGLMDASDLSAHVGEWATPMRARYRDIEVAELPPPTQGVAVLEIMRILDGYDLDSLEPADRAHMIIEAVKIGLRDRDDHVTDPAHAAVPPEALLADDWIDARARRRSIRSRPTSPQPGHPQRGGTAYLCAADGDGLLVSLIQSNFLGFGSGVHVPEWGINLNNRGSVVHARRDPGERARPVEAADAHAHSRDGAARRRAEPGVRLDGR